MLKKEDVKKKKIICMDVDVNIISDHSTLALLVSTMELFPLFCNMSSIFNKFPHLPNPPPNTPPQKKELVCKQKFSEGLLGKL